ncbi:MULTISPECIES: hypothetical protein [Sphingomonas]|uniref:Uncharacterized protein n=1 Tax=Sphingomonas leidyi TaxID=68569 RepID=A0A7X5V3C2_9SPHN|nr:hypothetical protein [Sphingomonas sp. 67-41]MBN8811280.1 hypothetical protein [Sphingomonas sp.]NIJ66586.1 hypothetical protein [Sphingomonas leidyi]OJY54735.1 MAG: hypothetical protein BGP17_06935 [Sphingomonas sp. 67-41]
MRVVDNGRHPNVRVTIEETAEIVRPPAPPPAPAKAGLPMLHAILFLLACIGGGIVVVAIRPFGLG